MADADDFDLEHFRNLLKGGAEAKAPAAAPAAKPARGTAAKRPAAGPAKAATGKAKPRRKRA